jgi:hypothetical protein
MLYTIQGKQFFQMFDAKTMPVALLVALNMVLGAGFLIMVPASAQSGSVEGSAQASYKTAYPKASADSDQFSHGLI